MADAPISSLTPYVGAVPGETAYLEISVPNVLSSTGFTTYRVTPQQLFESGLVTANPLYQAVSYTTSGTKSSLELDPSVVPFSATIACTLVSGSVNYKLQYSLDPTSVADADALWFDSGDIPSGTTTSAVSSFAFPAYRVRLIIASISGQLTMQVLQGVMIGDE